MDWGFKPFELGLPAEDLDYDEIWEGMPDYEEKPATVSEWKLIVHFRNLEDRAEFARLISQPLLPKTKYIWHPVRERGKPSDWAVLDEESE
jgi:hypothetical protein